MDRIYLLDAERARSFKSSGPHGTGRSPRTPATLPLFLSLSGHDRRQVATGGAGLRTPSDGDGWRRAATDGGGQHRRSVPEMYTQLLCGLVRREMAALDGGERRRRSIVRAAVRPGARRGRAPDRRGLRGQVCPSSVGAQRASHPVRRRLGAQGSYAWACIAGQRAPIQFNLCLSY